MFIGNMETNFKLSFDKLLLEGSFDLMFCTLINLYLIVTPETPQEFNLNFSGYSDIVNSMVTFFFAILIYLPYSIFSNSLRYFYSSLSAE
jgi:hypothetical protein